MGAAPHAPAPQQRKSHKGAIISIVVAVIVLAAAAVVLFYKPGFLNKTVFDQQAVEQGVATILTNAPTDDPAGYGYDNVSNVSCPADVEVTAGATFTCTLTLDGAAKTVTNTVVDDSGTYQVGPPQ